MANTCVCCPYPLVIIPFFLVSLAVIFTWVAGFNCTFFVITDTLDNGNSTYLNIGIWTIENTKLYVKGEAGDEPPNSFWHDDEDSRYCALWSDRYAQNIELDAAMISARVFSLAAGIMSLFAFCFMVVPFCVPFQDPKRYTRLMASFFVVIGVCVILDLTALASDICTGAEQCSLEGTGKLAIGASMVWFACAALMFVTFKMKNRGYPIEETPRQSASRTDREVRTVTNADGTTTTITKTTVTHPDGSTTTTETTSITEAPIAESVALQEESLVPIAAASVAPAEETIQEAAVMNVVDEEETPDPVTAKGVP